ncbi:DUF1989 domain-containing protein [Streptomyces acidicola]|uniref:DUF1989 domain-containing protein n=1 Tax=Streptomyces acidicola TaxID=2596892 RepID=UPI00343F446E
MSAGFAGFFFTVSSTERTGWSHCDHLADALVAYGLPYGQVSDPFNIFMNTGLDTEGKTEIHLPKSNAGDYVDLRAEMDLIVAVSACPDDRSDCNGGECSSLRVEILEGQAD